MSSSESQPAYDNDETLNFSIKIRWEIELFYAKLWNLELNQTSTQQVTSSEPTDIEK